MEQQDSSPMEQVLTTKTFTNVFGPCMVAGGDGPIPTPMDEVANLQFLYLIRK